MLDKELTRDFLEQLHQVRRMPDQVIRPMCRATIIVDGIAPAMRRSGFDFGITQLALDFNNQTLSIGHGQKCWRWPSPTGSSRASASMPACSGCGPASVHFGTMRAASMFSSTPT